MVNALFHPFKGGVEKHLLELSKALVCQGVQVHVLTAQLEGTKAFEDFSGVKVHRVPCTELRLPTLYPPPAIIAPGVYAKISELDKKYDFDVIHLQDRWFPDFSIALAYAKSVGKPFVVTLHNARPLGIAPHYTVFGSIYDALIGKPVLEKADLVICVSKWAVGDIANYGIPVSRMTAIHNGISVKDYGYSAAKATAFRKQYGFTKDQPLMLFVGRVIRQKGIDLLLKASAKIFSQTPDARLVIVGRGGWLEKMKALAQKLGIADKVLFLGFLSEDELKSALCGADVFVLPSLWEVLPVSILEAMASSRPVVCSDVGGNSELVRDGFNGFLVRKGDVAGLVSSVQRVLADKKLAARLGANGRRRAEKEFGWPLIASQTIDAYTALIASHKRTGPSPVPIGLELVALSEKMKAAAMDRYGNKLETSFKKYAKSFSTGLDKLLGSE